MQAQPTTLPGPGNANTDSNPAGTDTLPGIRPTTQETAGNRAFNPGAQSPNWLRSQPIENAPQDRIEAAPVQHTNASAPMTATATTAITPPESGAIRMPAENAGHYPIQTDGPRLRVSSNGPASISINKSASYEIVVENLDSVRAENVIVGIDFPQWVEITSSMPTTGTRESTTTIDEPRLIWEIPIVESSATEKIVIEVTPREARAFDVDVEWTFKPIRGKSTVEVTQPQLMIQMTGPTEVLYGEKALYHVTVSNPGSGTAENVVVMLPEILGGERASLGSIDPQQQKQFQVELIARSAGPMELITTVTADNDLNESDQREIMVRRAELEVKIDGPPMKYAGSTATYQLTVANQGDAMAREVMAAVALPPGVEYLSGIEGVEAIEGGIRWNVGMLSPGNHQTYQIICNMAAAGEINIEAATRGAGDLAATDKILTKVDAVADLVLTVADPKGPLPTGEQIEYEITIHNRGTKSAQGVDIVMHFSEGIEPVEGSGVSNQIAPGQVTFAPIAQIDPGQEVTLKVQAIASQPGSHRFRAQLLCEESDAHEVSEGTTRFFGDSHTVPAQNASTTELDNGFKR